MTAQAGPRVDRPAPSLGPPWSPNASLLCSPSCQPLADRFDAAGHRLYLVGGTVRDLLLGRDIAGDYDCTTDARPDETKRILTGWADAVWTQGERFGTIGAKRRARTFEITTHRAEAYQPDSRKPDVVYADAIDDDLSRRDFTVNAMALRIDGASTPELVDPFGGAADLATKRLRTPLSPGGQLQRRPAAHAAGGPLHRRLRARARARSSSPRSPRCATASRSCRPSASATSSTS